MAQPRRENPFLIFLVFLLLAAGVVYFLILVWEIPSPAEPNVRCDVAYEIFLGEDATPDQLCEPVRP